MKHPKVLLQCLKLKLLPIVDHSYKAGPKEEEYNCEMEGFVYTNRIWPDCYKKAQKFDTWQECQELCSKIEACKGFTYHTEKNFYSKACSLFSTFTGTQKWPNTVSGPKECSKPVAKEDPWQRVINNLKKFEKEVKKTNIWGK